MSTTTGSLIRQSTLWETGLGSPRATNELTVGSAVCVSVRIIILSLVYKAVHWTQRPCLLCHNSRHDFGDSGICHRVQWLLSKDSQKKFHSGSNTALVPLNLGGFRGVVTVDLEADVIMTVLSLGERYARFEAIFQSPNWTSQSLPLLPSLSHLPLSVFLLPSLECAWGVGGIFWTHFLQNLCV